MEEQTCCFTGHRRIPNAWLLEIIRRLDGEIERLYGLGVRLFLSGGALGFDQLAARWVLDARERRFPDVRLVMVLPCRDQDSLWGQGERRAYRELLEEADRAVYVSPWYEAGCMEKRNRRMADASDWCVCALWREHSGTGQTVRLARERGLKVVNVAPAEKG